MNEESEQWFRSGVDCLSRREMGQAESCFREFVNREPLLWEGYANLGFALEKQGRWAEAETCYRQAWALNPDSFQNGLNLGSVLVRQKKLTEAEAYYLRTLALSPASPAVYSSLGALYSALGREPEAERCLRLALEYQPDHPGANFNLGYLLLKQGRFREGWVHLDVGRSPSLSQVSLQCPRWTGESLSGHSILVLHEAGLGDMIQFCRYVPLLRERGATKIGVACHLSLKQLLSTLSGVDEVLALDESLTGAHWDFWVPQLSLPLHWETHLQNMPAQIPYLFASPELVCLWGRHVHEWEGLNVGLVWKGNPEFENDADRSLPSLQVLAPLWQIPGIRFYSLQKGPGEQEACHASPDQPLQALGEWLEDFAHTAAAIMNLDLVIGVDTSVIHLAGALGVPCWVLLPAYKVDWRWLSDRSDSPWYPEVMRLFRQHVPGVWDPVVSEVGHALLEKLSSLPATVQSPWPARDVNTGIPGRNRNRS